MNKNDKEFRDAVIKNFQPEDRLLSQLLCQSRGLSWIVSQILKLNHAETVKEFDAQPWIVRYIVDFGCLLDEWSVKIAERRYAEIKIKRAMLRKPHGA